MSLHGQVSVNGHAIGSWEAVRIGYQAGMGTYRCVAIRHGERRMADDDFVVFTVEHEVDAGALVLASRVLAEAATRLTL